MEEEYVIGMFDSGVGGLTVMKEVMKQLPQVKILYFGDTARVPYGNRTRDELICFGNEIVSFLIERGAQAIVVACNTSSANALPILKENFSIPMVGTIEPGASSAVKKTRNGHIGLIATEATVRSKAHYAAIKNVLAKGVYPEDTELKDSFLKGDRSIDLVKAQACPLFVPLIEAGLACTPEASGIARTYVEEIQEAGVDTLILGCTHYPFLSPTLREILGEGVELVDPSQAMVDELKEVLANVEPREKAESSSQYQFFVSGDPELFQQVGNTFLPSKLQDIIRVNLKK